MPRATLGLDRSSPVYFAGRKAELAALDKHLADIRRGERCGIALIDGIPGAGKTQLLREFATRVRARDSAVRHVDLQTNDLNDPAAEIFGSIVAPLRQEAQPFREGAADRSGLGAMLRRSDAQLWENRALVVTIDEVQNVSPTGRSVLSVLHEGSHGRPIMVAAAGLTSSLKVLSATRQTLTGTVDRDTISRIATVLTLGPLSRAETEEALMESVAACTGLTIPRKLLDTLAEASSGFPQHVHCYARACVETAEVLTRLDTPDAVEAVTAMGDGYRKNYYDLRLKTINQRYRPVVVRLAHSMAASKHGAAIAWNEAVAVAERTLNSRLEDGRMVVEMLMDKGILEMRDNSEVFFPMPSFHGYMMSFPPQRSGVGNGDEARREKGGRHSEEREVGSAGVVQAVGSAWGWGVPGGGGVAERDTLRSARRRAASGRGWAG